MSAHRKDVLRVAATSPSIAYLPHYLAGDLGYFEEAGLRVHTVAHSDGRAAAEAVLGDRADIGIGGIWRLIMYRGRLGALVAIAQLCARAPAVLLHRAEEAAVVGSELTGKKVLVPKGAPSALALLSHILRRNGVDVCTLNFVTNLAEEECVALFRAGWADFLLASPPTTDTLIEDAVATPLIDLASLGGSIPWSVYYVTPNLLQTHADALSRFGLAIRRALTAVVDDSAEMRRVLLHHLPELPIDVAVPSANSCRARGVWAKRERIRPQDLARWQEALVGAGLVDEPVAYDDIARYVSSRSLRGAAST